MSVHHYTLSADLVPGATTAALLRVVSVLHGRCAEVRQLAFHSGAEGASRVTAEVTLSNAGSQTLQASLARNVEVLAAHVSRRAVPTAIRTP
jgi:hypothetical protein